MPHAVKPDIGAAMARLLAESESGRPLRELAADIGVDHGTVGRWLRGDTPPTGTRIAALLRWAGQPTQAHSDDYRRGLADEAERMAALVEILRTEAHGPDPRLLAADAPMPTERDAGRGTAPAAGAPPRAPRRARGL
jgi:transcriptional regulator with XRE-family HTH domain